MTVAALAQVDEQAAAARAAGATDADLNLIERLKSRAYDFRIARADLQRLGAAVAKTNDYDAMMEYSRLVNRADSIQTKIGAATTAIDNAVQWARSALGDLTEQQLGALGLVWLLPSAIILGAIAVIGYWLTDYRKFSARFDEQTRIATDLVAGGMDPAAANIEAGRAVAATAPGLFDFGNVATFGAIALVGVLLFLNTRR